MKNHQPASNFWVIGLSYHKSDTLLRSKYAVNEVQYEAILQHAPEYGISSLFVLSTCNRTELYGFATDALMLVHLLCSHTEGDITGFLSQAYIKNGDEVLEHIFHVAAGLDSQILGDYEIVGQIKKSFHFSKTRGFTNIYLDRLFNTVLQSSRAIRSSTQLSSGTVSVAFAAVQFITSYVKDLTNTQILILGSGEIGCNACRNLIPLSGNGNNITIINRSPEKAKAFAAETGIRYAQYEELPLYIQKSEIILVATAATYPLICYNDFLTKDRKILIDLSIPNNIDPDVSLHSEVILANVDDLSKINDATYKKREAEIPIAKALINDYIHTFKEWLQMRRHAPILKGVKEKLNDLNVCFFDEVRDTEEIQKAVNEMAKKIRVEANNRLGCNYIETLNYYLAAKARDNKKTILRYP